MVLLYWEIDLFESSSPLWKIGGKFSGLGLGADFSYDLRVGRNVFNFFALGEEKFRNANPEIGNKSTTFENSIRNRPSSSEHLHFEEPLLFRTSDLSRWLRGGFVVRMFLQVSLSTSINSLGGGL